MELPPSRHGNWNGNSELANGAKFPSCGNPYIEYYQQLIKNHMEKATDWDAYEAYVEEKKCTCGDTESQHYENMGKCLVCECKEFEEAED